MTKRAPDPLTYGAAYNPKQEYLSRRIFFKRLHWSLYIAERKTYFTMATSGGHPFNQMTKLRITNSEIIWDHVSLRDAIGNTLHHLWQILAKNVQVEVNLVFSPNLQFTGTQGIQKQVKYRYEDTDKFRGEALIKQNSPILFKNSVP